MGGAGHERFLASGPVHPSTVSDTIVAVRITTAPHAAPRHPSTGCQSSRQQSQRSGHRPVRGRTADRATPCHRRPADVGERQQTSQWAAFRHGMA
jgi:hypothetical protein